MNRKIGISLAVGIVASALTLILALRKVPIPEIGQYLRQIDYVWMIPATGLILLSFGLRALRWQMLLHATRRVDYWSTFHPLMIGFMINCILPGRVGEMARPMILKKKRGIPFSTGLATVAAERAFDMMVLLVMFVLVFLTVEIDSDLVVRFGDMALNRGTLQSIATSLVKVSLGLLLGIGLVSSTQVRRTLEGLLQRTADWIPDRYAQIKTRVHRMVRLLSQVMDGVASGFYLLKSPLKIGLCTILSVAIWLLMGLSYYIFALGCPGIDLALNEQMAVMVMICLFIALPSVPGYWGLWEAGGVFAMSIFGIPADQAAGFTLANHFLQIFPVILAGLFSALVTSVNIMKVAYAAPDDHV